MNSAKEQINYLDVLSDITQVLEKLEQTIEAIKLQQNTLSEKIKAIQDKVNTGFKTDSMRNEIIQFVNSEMTKLGKNLGETESRLARLINTMPKKTPKKPVPPKVSEEKKVENPVPEVEIKTV